MGPCEKRERRLKQALFAHANGGLTMTLFPDSLGVTQIEAPLDEYQIGQTSPCDVLQLQIGQASSSDVLQVDVGHALISKQPPTSPTDAILSPVSTSINRLRRLPRSDYTSPRWARASLPSVNEADDSGRAREPRQLENSFFPFRDSILSPLWQRRKIEPKTKGYAC